MLRRQLADDLAAQQPDEATHLGAFQWDRLQQHHADNVSAYETASTVESGESARFQGPGVIGARCTQVKPHACIHSLCSLPCITNESAISVTQPRCADTRLLDFQGSQSQKRALLL